MTNGEKLFYFIMVLMIVMVNPPFITWISNHSKNNLLTAGVPTFWLWLEFWFLVGAIAFLFAAWKLPSWRKGENIDVEKGPLEEVKA